MQNKVARAFVVSGSVVLIATAALHILGGFKVGFPALEASTLEPKLRDGFRVVFISLAWHWILVAILALIAGYAETKLRKVYILLCGLALLLEAAVGAALMGIFIGNEMVGTAAVLLLAGALLFDKPGANLPISQA